MSLTIFGCCCQGDTTPLPPTLTGCELNETEALITCCAVSTLLHTLVLTGVNTRVSRITDKGIHFSVYISRRNICWDITGTSALSGRVTKTLEINLTPGAGGSHGGITKRETTCLIWGLFLKQNFMAKVTQRCVEFLAFRLQHTTVRFGFEFRNWKKKYNKTTRSMKLGLLLFDSDCPVSLLGGRTLVMRPESSSLEDQISKCEDNPRVCTFYARMSHHCHWKRHSSFGWKAPSTDPWFGYIFGWSSLFMSSSVRALGSQSWWVCGNILWLASSSKGFYRSEAVAV